ncbi:accessory Sec system glycosyltransferase Asp1 [Levilactobacillus bambusae]|uniref:Accessory Sec system protein Asp1 n=1 Tax=Levilactobacillus bambusae TaxID=2024736 RepID=A0A2V1MXC2_9LACO|nr:accessory Sec system glycosyltransferase Asp1 [Levilactobacillus bambusae]PWF99710.1 hypothetical protein DCM90_06525 [Levilactobacillus bambusae]
MLYLVPDWSANNQLEYDPIMNYAWMLTQQHEPFRLLILQSIPQLRYLLHQYDLTETPLVNMFDVIQQVTRTAGLPYNVDDLNWPADTQEVYTAQNVLQLKNDQIQAIASVGDSGQLSVVEHLVAGQAAKIELFDDRGFKSNEKMVDTYGNITEQRWYNDNGRLLYHVDEKGEVDVLAPKDPAAKTHYASLDDLLIDATLRRIDPEDRFIMSDSLNLKPIAQGLMKDHQVALSVGQELTADFLDFPILIAPSDAIKDRWIRFSKRQRMFAPELNIAPISPYPAELSFGMSNDEAQMIIDWHVGDENSERVTEIAGYLANWLVNNEDWAILADFDNWDKVHFVEDVLKGIAKSVFHIDPDSKEARQLQDFLERQRLHRIYKADMLMYAHLRTLPNWDQLNGYAQLFERFNWVVGPSQSDYVKNLHAARILLDLSAKTNLFLQVEAISVGIPQIVQHGNGYVVKQNGAIRESPADLKPVLDRFLNHLNDWNISLIANVRLTNENLVEDQVAKLKEVWTYGDHH